MRRTTTVLRSSGAFSATLALRLHEKIFENQYLQERFEAMKAMKKSKTYPGPIKAATPGDTRFWFAPDDYDRHTGPAGVETIIHENERHFWRSVVDDVLVEPRITLRVRFKEELFLAPQWETRLHVISIHVPIDSTIAEVKAELKTQNVHPHVAHRAFDLALDGKELSPSDTLASLNIEHNTALDAIETDFDHLYHTPAGRPKDWNHEEVSATEAAESPYREVIAARENDEEGKRASWYTKPLSPPTIPESVRLGKYVP